MSIDGELGGIYITRKYVLASRTYEDFPIAAQKPHEALSENALDSLEIEKFNINPRDPTRAIHDAIDWLGGKEQPPQAVGVGCYGPFLSLKRGKHYGELKAFQGPLKHENLFELVREGFGKKIADENIIVQTDVAVSALGEAFSRMNFNSPKGRLDFDDVLVYLLFSEGVGGSFVQKLTIWSGRHHPEMGQIPVHMHSADRPMASDDRLKRVSSYRLQNLASELAFKKRLNLQPFDPFPTRLTDREDRRAMFVQASYIAQLCASATYSIAPSMIILSGDMLRIEGMLQAVRSYFEAFMLSEENGYYSFYDDMQREGGFICYPSIAEPGILGTLCIAAKSIREQLEF